MADDERTITRAEMQRQHQGARRIAPGIWLDRHGHPHFSVPELLEMVGLPDTPENREEVERDLRDIARRAGLTVIAQHEES